MILADPIAVSRHAVCPYSEQVFWFDHGVAKRWNKCLIDCGHCESHRHFELFVGNHVVWSCPKYVVKCMAGGLDGIVVVPKTTGRA